MSKRSIDFVIWAVSVLSIFWVASAQAQAQGGEWSSPYRLSSENGKASEAYLVADRYGYVHCFWTEMLFEDKTRIIKYARFDGETWSNPNDIYVTGVGITNVSPFLYKQGTLHIAWAEGLTGPAYYTHAPANDAISAQNWAQPMQINIPARTLHLRIDSRGVFHILYINQTEEPGIYYIRSEDRGVTWSEPVWIDPDILPGHIPESLSFELDETDGLHAVWFYGALEQTAKPDWVRYTHSFDGGHTWSVPLLIDKYDEGSEHNLTFASPNMIVQGHTVHVIWAAGELPYRYHRFSTDAGQTWSAPRRLFGELHGQAFDGLALDRAGRVHFFGQIRYPLGIYHAYWDQNHWSSPSLVYFIAQEGSEDGVGDRIHAHHTHPVVRAGNQLVLTFGDGPADPNRRLFAMQRTLEDIAPLEAVATPLPIAAPAPAPSPTPGQPTRMPASTATAPLFDTAVAELPGQVSRPDLSIWVAMIPTVIILGIILAVRLLYKSRL